MKKCILHIGMNKTGSSSIQNYLTKFSNDLGEGVKYANLGSANHSGAFSYIFVDNLLDIPTYKLRELTHTLVRKKSELFRKRLEFELNSDFKTIIFSAEELAILTEKELQNLKNKLLNYVDEIKVVAYVRTPLSFMESAFQQRVKVRVIELDYKLLYPKYKVRFEKFEQIFGAVEYSLFEKKSLIGGDVIQDFCNKQKVNFHQSLSSNISLSGIATKFLYLYQKARKEITITQEKIEILESTLKNIEGDKFRFPQQYEKIMREEFDEDYIWMNSRIKFPHGSAIKDKKIQFDLKKFSREEYFELQKLTKIDRFKKYFFKECGVSIDTFLYNNFVNKINHHLEYKINISHVSSFAISGWVINLNNVNEKIILSIFINKIFVIQVKADQFREDLVANNLGNSSGHYAFKYKFEQKQSLGSSLDVLIDDVVVLSHIL
jgi:hypothetical protein